VAIAVLQLVQSGVDAFKWLFPQEKVTQHFASKGATYWRTALKTPKNGQKTH
jgi:hypothetical protein